MSILNSCVLSNAVASNSPSLRDTVSLMSEQKEMHEKRGLKSVYVTFSVLLKHIFGISNHKQTHLESDGSNKVQFKNEVIFKDYKK